MTALLLIVALYFWCIVMGYLIGVAGGERRLEGVKIGAQVATAFTLTGLIIWGAVAVSTA